MPVLLIAMSNRREDLDFSQKVAKKSGFDFDICSSPSHLEEMLIERPQSLLFWDVDASERAPSSHITALGKNLPVLGKHLKPRHCFGLTSNSIHELKQAKRSHAIGHFCVRNYDEFGVNWISRLCIPLFSPNPFGLEFYADQDAKIHTIELKASKERKIAIEAVGRLLQKREIAPRALEMILNNIDELTMNAIFHAPIADDKRYRADAPRNSEFLLEGKERIFFNLVFNKEFVVIGVRDQFGSFEPDKAFDAAKKDYREIGYKPETGAESTGLGLHKIAMSGMGMLISCKKRIATEAVIAFPYYKSFKQSKDGFRSFSFNVR